MFFTLRCNGTWRQNSAPVWAPLFSQRRPTANMALRTLTWLLGIICHPSKRFYDDSFDLVHTRSLAYGTTWASVGKTYRQPWKQHPYSVNLLPFVCLRIGKQGRQNMLWQCSNRTYLQPETRIGTEIGIKVRSLDGSWQPCLSTIAFQCYEGRWSPASVLNNDHFETPKQVLHWCEMKECTYQTKESFVCILVIRFLLSNEFITRFSGFFYWAERSKHAHTGIMCKTWSCNEVVYRAEISLKMMR